MACDGAMSLFPQSDHIIDFPDISLSRLQVGQSRRIVKGQFVGLSRMMASTPLPHFPDVDRYTGIGRQQFFRKRYEAAGGAGGWGHEFQSCFMDGDGLGIGFLRWGVDTNPDTGLQRVSVKHSPTIRTLLDMHERNPYRSRWVAFVTYMAPEDAKRKYDPVKVENATVEMMSPDGRGDIRPLRVVRVIHYYDIGYTPGRTPTYMCFLGAVDKSNGIKRSESPSGTVLPLSMYVHYFAPGMSRPTGRIILQMQSQKALNNAEMRLQATIRNGGGLRELDATQLDEQDMANVAKGLTNIVRNRKPDPNGRHAIKHIPPIDLHPADLAYYQMMREENTQQSGVDEMDRSGMGQKGSTATQNVIQERKSAGDENWSKFQTAQMLRQSVEMMSLIAKRWDRDPVQINMLGSTITINNIEDPNSGCEYLFETPSTVQIDETKITFQSARDERRERLMELSAIEPLVAAGLVNPIKFAQEKVKAATGEDPDDGWINPILTGAASGGAAGMMAGQAVAGAPGQGQPIPATDGDAK